MKRRTMLQGVLAFFGIGAPKAQADGFRISCRSQLDTITGRLDATVGLSFKSVIGVVVRNGVLHFATRDLFTNDAKPLIPKWVAGRYGFYDQECLDRLVDMANKTDAMIVPEANGPWGQKLVQELQLRIPERLYYRKRGCGGFYHVRLHEEVVKRRLSLSRWSTNDPDDAMARYCTLFGIDELHKRKGT